MGYSGGETENPTYEDVCYKNTNHAEVVKVIYDPNIIKLNKILKVFWECHDPTQGMRQGNDIGEQYRSVIFCKDSHQLDAANISKKVFQTKLDEKGFGPITTEIKIETKTFPAEDYHQQYLAKNPDGYCNLKGTGCFL